MKRNTDKKVEVTLRMRNIKMTPIPFYILCLWIITPVVAQKGDNTVGESRINEEILLKLIERVNDLETRDQMHENRIKELQTEVRLLNQKISEKDRDNSNLRKLLLRRVAKPLKQADNQETTGNEGQTKQAELNGGNRIRRVENEAAVAFTTGLTQRSLHLGPNQNVVFDHVETNLGGGYNVHHGVFTVPVAGTYVFFSSILSDNNGEIWCRLAVNGVNKADIYARGTDGRHDQGSQMIVVQLNKGDDVSVQNMIGDHAVYGDNGIYSTFSGFLLQQDYAQTPEIVVG